MTAYAETPNPFKEAVMAQNDYTPKLVTSIDEKKVEVKVEEIPEVKKASPKKEKK